MAAESESRIKKILEEIKAEEEKRNRALTIFARDGITTLTMNDAQRRQYRPQIDALEDADRNLNRLRQELSALQLIVMNESVASLNTGVNTLNESVANLRSATEQTTKATEDAKKTTTNLLKSSTRLEIFSLLLVAVTAATFYLTFVHLVQFPFNVIAGVLILILVIFLVLYPLRLKKEASSLG